MWFVSTYRNIVEETLFNLKDGAEEIRSIQYQHLVSSLLEAKYRLKSLS